MRKGTFRLISAINNQLFGYGCSKNRMSGLTLVEMLVSITVIGLVSFITLPVVIAQLTGGSIEGNAKEISSALMIARVKSIETQTPHRVKFDLNSNPQKFIIQRGITSQGATTWVDNVTIKEMKENVVINRVDDNGGRDKTSGIGSIEFDRLGNPTKGVVYLEDNKSEKYTITLNAATGRVTKIKG